MFVAFFITLGMLSYGIIGYVCVRIDIPEDVGVTRQHSGRPTG